MSLTERTITYDDALTLPFRVNMRRHWDKGGWGLFLTALEVRGVQVPRRLFRVKNLIIEEGDETDFFPPQPPLFLPKELGGVEEIMDELWREGVRPQGHRDATAVEAHLADVKRILDIILPSALRKTEPGTTLPVPRDRMIP